MATLYDFHDFCTCSCGYVYLTHYVSFPPKLQIYSLCAENSYMKIFGCFICLKTLNWITLNTTPLKRIFDVYFVWWKLSCKELGNFSYPIPYRLVVYYMCSFFHQFVKLKNYRWKNYISRSFILTSEVRSAHSNFGHFPTVSCGQAGTHFQCLTRYQYT